MSLTPPNTCARPRTCPGVHVLAAMRDGAMARVRVPGGRLTARAARLLAGASDTIGNGRVDLTNRANIQLRGLDEARLPELHALLDEAGLMPRAPETDRARNLVVSPLPARDEVAEGGADLAARVRRLLDMEVFPGLPVKAALVLDLGAGDVIGLGHDVGLVLTAPDEGRETWALSLAGTPQPHMLATEVAVPALRAVLAEMAAARARTTPPRALAALRAAAIPLLPGADAPPCWPSPAQDIGRVGPHALALGIPSTGLVPAQLERLAAMAEAGDGLLRLAPGRRVVLAGLGAEAMRACIREGAALGLATTPPAIRIQACAGGSGCDRTRRDIRADARALEIALAGEATITGRPRGSAQGASRTGQSAPVTIHLTGCRRGCAHPRPADWLARAEGDRYALFRDARADVERGPDHTASYDAAPAALADLLGADPISTTDRDAA